MWYCSCQPEWQVLHLGSTAKCPLRLPSFTLMQHLWHLPNLRSLNSARLTKSWFLPWNRVGGSASAGPGWWQQETFPINLSCLESNIAYMWKALQIMGYLLVIFHPIKFFFTIFHPIKFIVTINNWFSPSRFWGSTHLLLTFGTVYCTVSDLNIKLCLWPSLHPWTLLLDHLILYNSWGSCSLLSKFSVTLQDSFVSYWHRWTNILKMSVTDIIHLYVSPSMVAGILTMLIKSTWCLNCTLYTLIGLRGAFFWKKWPHLLELPSGNQCFLNDTKR